MLAKPDIPEPPIEVLKDIAMLAVADFFKIAPDKLQQPFELGGAGIDSVSSKFHTRFHNLIYGFDEGMLWWYLTGAKSVDEIAVAVQGYIQELLRT